MSDWLFIVCFIALFIGFFFLIVMLIDGNRYKVISYELESEKIGKDYRFVLLADLHNKSYGKNNRKLITKIHSLKPEAIFVAGDILTVKNGCSYARALQLLKELAEEYPVYYGMGNHESRLFLHPEVYKDMGLSYERELKACKVPLLRNESVDIGDELRVTGLEIERGFYRHFKTKPMGRIYLEETLGPPSSEKYQILLAHNPDYFADYAQWGADLVLAGHVHGGIMRLPFFGGVISPALCLFPKYDGGLYREGKSTMILSRGLGAHTIPVRIFNPGELVVFTLKAK